MSCRNFLTSLILTKRKIPLEYRLMTCFPNAFAVFFTFFVQFTLLYSTYILLIISSLALSTLSCVHWCPNKCALPMLMTLFNSCRFYAAQCLSLVYQQHHQKTHYRLIAIIFIKCRNRHHMKNNIRYKGNINNTSVIIFLKLEYKNSQRCYFDYENLRRGFISCWSSFRFCIFISFLIFILLMFFIGLCSSFTFAFRHHVSPIRRLSSSFCTHFILSAQPIAAWYATLPFSTIPLSSCRERYGF